MAQEQQQQWAPAAARKVTENAPLVEFDKLCRQYPAPLPEQVVNALERTVQTIVSLGRHVHWETGIAVRVLQVGTLSNCTDLKDIRVLHRGMLSGNERLTPVRTFLIEHRFLGCDIE